MGLGIEGMGEGGSGRIRVNGRQMGKLEVIESSGKGGLKFTGSNKVFFFFFKGIRND